MKKRILTIISIIFLFSFFAFYSTANAIEFKDLANICESMENSINDISIDYKLFVDPPFTKDDIAETGELITTEPAQKSLISKKPFAEHYLCSEEGTYMNGQGHSYKGSTKISYNGDVGKLFQKGGMTSKGELSNETMRGKISKGKHFFQTLDLTPLGFSVIRFQLAEGHSLSEMLKNDKIATLDNTVIKVNDFNSITVNINPIWGKQIIRKIYFAIDYGYTPIRYEYLNDSKVTLTIDVNSLQEVQKGLWFPSSGSINKIPTSNERANVYIASGKININQNVKNEDFDVEFPGGTKVSDEVTGKMYTIKPTQEQVDQSLPK